MTTDEYAQSLVDAMPHVVQPDEHLERLAMLWLMRETILTALTEKNIRQRRLWHRIIANLEETK